ncbi:MAG: hypothetical protein ACFB12_05380 [Leptolyngbyaceae cyanobacterium]
MMWRNRALIETVNAPLKNVMQIEGTAMAGVFNFRLNTLKGAGITSRCLMRSPQLAEITIWPTF